MAAKCCCLTQQLLISTLNLRNVFILPFLHHKSTPSKDEDEPLFFSFSCTATVYRSFENSRSNSGFTYIQINPCGQRNKKGAKFELSFEMHTSQVEQELISYYHQAILLVEVIMVLIRLVGVRMALL